MARVSAGQRTRSKRRGNNEGTEPFQRSDGRWCAAVSVDGAKRKWVYGKDREDVADKLIAVLSTARQGLPIPNERLTTAAYLDDWLEHTVKPGRKPLTYLRYRQAARVHIVPTLGRSRSHASAPLMSDASRRGCWRRPQAGQCPRRPHRALGGAQPSSQVEPGGP